MDPTLNEPAPWRSVSMILLAVIITTFALANLPWHLDNYDQAKQAFVSFEMVENGQWWFQHTPSGRVATKPPLAGWISAALYFAMGKNGWEFAWRLPSFVSVLVLLALLWRSGGELGGPRGALLAVCAFGCNLLAPHLATLARTDMLLTLFIFLAGWLTLQKVRRAEPWTTRERWWLALAMLGSLLTKGPILYAFLLPGLAAFAILMRRRGTPNYAWAGWWPWFAPLLMFAIWAGVGIWLSHDFYRQVVQIEFLGRFDMRAAPVHKHQPLWFYFVHMLHRWGPWSLALIALAFHRPIRSLLRAQPALLWLACWGIGGLLFMSLVPSKRVDRIFPIIPPLALLLAALGSHWLDTPSRRRTRTAVALVTLGVLVSTIYVLVTVTIWFGEDRRSLLRFGERVREITNAEPDRFALVSADDEGLLLYTGRTRFASYKDARRGWKHGELDRLLIGKKELREHDSELQPYKHRQDPPPIKGTHDHYFVIEREHSGAEAPLQP